MPEDIQVILVSEPFPKYTIEDSVAFKSFSLTIRVDTAHEAQELYHRLDMTLKEISTIRGRNTLYHFPFITIQNESYLPKLQETVALLKQAMQDRLVLP